MKKHLLSLFAMACMVFASSCTSEEIVSQSTGNEVAVTFTAHVRNDVKSRAVGDDTDGIDQLVFAVYDENQVLLPLTQEISLSDANNTTDGKKKVEIKVVLVKGQTYSFAFWAQDKDYSAYTFNPETKTVSINYPQDANQKFADAFFANYCNYTVTGSFEKEITLKRPFAQVNFLTTQADFVNAKNAGFEPDKSGIVVANAATSLNVLTGEVGGDVSATFNLAQLIEENENTTIYQSNTTTPITLGSGNTPTEFRYLATAYFLPTEATAETTITASMSAVQTNKSSKAPVELKAEGIKARRNFRTNIYGNLLTSNGTFYVTVDPGFDGDYSVSSDELTETYTSLAQALEDNKDNSGVLIYNVETEDNSGLSNVAIEIPTGTNASSMTFNLEDLTTGATITISNENGGNYGKTVVVEVPEGVNLGNIDVNLPNAHVTLKQGNYTQVFSATSGTTLEIGEGTTIGTLEVKQGNVRILEGGKIETITNKTSGVIYVLMAGGEWTNIASADGKTIAIYEDTKHTFVLNNKYSVDSKVQNLFNYASTLGINDRTITFAKDVTEDITILQEGHINLVFDGCGKNFNSSITIDGNRVNGGGPDSKDALTFRNIKFKTSDPEKIFISSNRTYAHNVTIENCEFISDKYNESVSGINFIQVYHINIVNTIAKNMHSLAQFSSIDNYVNVDKVTIENCKSGISFGNTVNATLSNSNISVSKYGVRGESNSQHSPNKLVVVNSTINAKTPVFIRKVNTNTYDVALENTTLKATDMYEVVFTNGTDDLEKLETPTGIYSIIGAADNYNVYPMAEDAVYNAQTIDQLKAILASGKNVKLNGDIAIAKSEAGGNGYGATGINQLNGGIIDGNGHKISVNAWGTWDSAINTTGGTIKNVKVTGGMRGIFVNHNSTNSEKVILENVIIDGTVYTISCDQGTNKGLEAYNSTFNGWTSYAATIGNVKFDNCNFGKGQGYAYCRPYAPTEFVNCTFAAGFELEPVVAVTFENCTIGGVALTAENLSTLVISNIDNASVK